MSHFAVLEHIDDEGQLGDSLSLEEFQEVSNRKNAKSSRLLPAKQGAGAPAAKGGTSGQPGPSRTAHTRQQPADNGLKGNVDSYYRAFEHVYRDPGTGDTVLRFHKSNIVVIKPSGDVVLDTHGWYTFTTWAAMNDALQAINIKVRYQGAVSDGSWALIDDTGRHKPYHDGIIVPSTKPAHKHRAAAVMKAYAGGSEVPVYAITKPLPAAAAGMGTAAGPAGTVTTAMAGTAGTAVNFAATIQQQQPTAPKTSAKQPAMHVPRKTVHEQLQEAIEELDMHDELEGDDEDVCVVCLHHSREEVLVPCGHLVLCTNCCLEIVSKAGECPVCRESIIGHCRLDSGIA